MCYIRILTLCGAATKESSTGTQSTILEPILLKPSLLEPGLLNPTLVEPIPIKSTLLEPIVLKSSLLESTLLNLTLVKAALLALGSTSDWASGIETGGTSKRLVLASTSTKGETREPWSPK
jgi:hypothetical protein